MLVEYGAESFASRCRRGWPGSFCVKKTMRKNEVCSGNQLTLSTSPSALAGPRRLGEKRLLNGNPSGAAHNRITAETAHDLNNALGSIRLYVDLLEAEPHDAGKVLRHVRQMKPAVEHAASLARELLGLGPAQQPSPPISLNCVLEGMGPMLSTLPRRDVALRLRLSPSLAAVAIDPAHVIRIVLNLVLNACDAMPQGGEVMIETSNWRVESPSGKTRSSQPTTPPTSRGDQASGWVMLRVRDTGRGMSDATRARAFQPYFTSKPPAKPTANLRREGAGLGLPSVLRMVEKAGGTIQVESLSGKGTDITMLFPGYVQKTRSRQDGLHPPKKSPPKGLSSGSGAQSVKSAL